MDDDELLSIGRFARLSGLSVGALRHYDELDILRPAEVDRDTGYRRYRRGQLETARAIARLRELEVPLDEVRSILAADDPGERQAALERHRRRLEARSARLGRVLHHVHQLSTGREPIVSETAAPTAPTLDPATERALAVDLFNHAWALMEVPDRTAGQDDELIHAAHASRHHWGRVGEPVNLARGEWQCSRVYAVLGRPEGALHHARRCLAILEGAGGGEDWDLAAAYEAMARASFLAGDPAAARKWRTQAEAELAGIADPADREVIEQDLATLPFD